MISKLIQEDVVASMIFDRQIDRQTTLEDLSICSTKRKTVNKKKVQEVE